jgi:hypothetical protein
VPTRRYFFLRGAETSFSRAEKASPLDVLPPVGGIIVSAVLAGTRDVRTIAEYLAKAEEFERLAKSAPLAELRKCYADVAEGYRIMATERKRLITKGIVVPDPEKNGRH